MKIIVSGASGFVGSELSRRLADQGHDAVALVRDKNRAPSGVDSVLLDLAHRIRPTDLPSQVDVVVHLAQSNHYRRFPNCAEDIFAVNVASTAALLEYARSAEATRFVLASSGGVFQPTNSPIGDDAQVDPPENFYQRSKYCAELISGPYREFFEVAILRPFFMYGPGQEGKLISNLASLVRERREIPLSADPGLRLNPIHRDDAVAAFASAAVGPAPTGPVNVAGPEIASVRGIATLLAELDGYTPKFKVESSSVSDGDLIARTDRMTEQLGVTPSISLRKGLESVLVSLRAGPSDS